MATEPQHPHRGPLTQRQRVAHRVVVETPVGLNDKQKQLLKELQESFGGPTGEKNSPRSKSFFDGVKKFFDDLTR